MHIAKHLRERRWPVSAVVAVSALVALVVAVASSNTISLFPPKLGGRSLQIAGAATHVLIDPPAGWRPAGSSDFDALTTRAGLLADMMASRPVVERIGRRVGVSANRIAAVPRITANVPAVLKEPDSEKRASDILLSTRPYRIDIETDATRPILDLYTQAPTPAGAERLARAAVDGLRDYLGALAIRDGVKPGGQVSLRQIGQPRGAVLNRGTGLQIAMLTFLVVFAVCTSLGLFLRRGRRDSSPAPSERADRPLRPIPSPSGRSCEPRWPRGILALSTAAGAPRQIVLPRPLPQWRSIGTRRRPRARNLAVDGGDWPRTTRVLPWMIAGFIAMLWLVPFNVIELDASLPFDLKLDRLLLPLIAGTWVLWLAAGGHGATRPRVTWIHAAVGAFLLLACLSVVLDARYLNQTLELNSSIKQLTVLVAYISLFVMVASIVRRSEVGAFLKYTLVLAVICAVGMIVEYRFQYNVFYDLSDKLLPGFFHMDLNTSASFGLHGSSVVDDSGRRLVSGPAEAGLEAVAMLAMALPIALVGMLDATRLRGRILYGIAACLILAAAMSTYRKSAFLAPISVGLTIAYFRRNELLKLTPLLLVLVLAIHVLSPGAFGSVVDQLHPSSLGVSTVSDRTADYDAIRPDVWTHLAFGRGFGSYSHVNYRILDSDLLSRLVDMGVVGLAAYVLVMVSVIATARRVIRSRHPKWAPIALVCASAAVAILVASALFDVMSFPHVPYIFLTLAAFLAVIVGQPREES